MMALLGALRDRLRRWPRPDDVTAVRRMTSEQWRGIAARTPTYLQAYLDRPGSADRAQRRAEWLAAQPVWEGASSVLELGCACGRNLAALRRRWDLRVSGVDISLAALAEAERILPGGQFCCANLYELATARPLPADVVLTCGVLGHLEPSAVGPLLGWMLRAARRAVVLVEEPGQGEVLKGPRPWAPRDRVSDDYVLWGHRLFRGLIDAGARRLDAIPLPEDLCAPGATRLLVARR